MKRQVIFVLVTIVLMSLISIAQFRGRLNRERPEDGTTRCGRETPARVQAAEIQGTFLLVPHKSDDIVQLVESTVSKVNAAIRPIARIIIANSIVANKMVSITSSGNTITILADGNQLPTVCIDGTARRYRSPDGDIVNVGMLLEGKRLEQIFSTEYGSMTNLCELSQDGHELTMKIVIRSAYFEKPLTYKLLYEKTSSVVASMK
jgi:hypothetical protein